MRCVGSWDCCCLWGMAWCVGVFNGIVANGMRVHACAPWQCPTCLGQAVGVHCELAGHGRPAGSSLELRQFGFSSLDQEHPLIDIPSLGHNHPFITIITPFAPVTSPPFTLFTCTCGRNTHPLIEILILFSIDRTLTHIVHVHVW